MPAAGNLGPSGRHVLDTDADNVAGTQARRPANDDFGTSPFKGRNGPTRSGLQAPCDRDTGRRMLGSTAARPTGLALPVEELK